MKKIWEILKGKYLTKSIENRLHLNRRLYRFQLKRGKLPTNLVNVDVVNKEEDKALILLSSLPDEDYKTFSLTLINSKQSLDYNEIFSALINHELRKKDKESSNSTSAEALTVRGRSFSRKGKGGRGRSKFRVNFKDLNKNRCAFYKELEH